MATHSNGLFVTFEGGEGAGKSSLLEYLTTRIKTEFPDIDLSVTREPGNSSIGSNMRELILGAQSTLTGRTEALLFAADRAQHVAEVIRPALNEGHLVLCDRFVASSIAYQGFARGLGSEEIAAISEFATGGLTPHRTYILDIDPSIGIERKIHQKELNSMELEGMEFHENVRSAFLALAEAENAVLIDANRPIEDIQRDCWTDLKNTLRLFHI